MQEGRKKHAFALEASAWLMFANIPLPKAGHLEKPKVGVERDYKVLRQREAINQAHKCSQPVTHTHSHLNAFACVSSLVSSLYACVASLVLHSRRSCSYTVYQ